MYVYTCYLIATRRIDVCNYVVKVVGVFRRKGTFLSYDANDLLPIDLVV